MAAAAAAPSAVRALVAPHCLHRIGCSLPASHDDAPARPMQGMHAKDALPRHAQGCISGPSPASASSASSAMQMRQPFSSASAAAAAACSELSGWQYATSSLSLGVKSGR